MANVSKRNLIALLGLAPVSVAVNALTDDKVVRDPEWGWGEKRELSLDAGVEQLRVARYDLDKVCSTFRRLASLLRLRQLNLSRFHIGTECVSDTWLTQTLTIDLEMMNAGVEAPLQTEEDLVSSEIGQLVASRKKAEADVDAWKRTALALRDAAIAFRKTGDVKHYDAIENMYMDAALLNRHTVVYRAAG